MSHNPTCIDEAEEEHALWLFPYINLDGICTFNEMKQGMGQSIVKPWSNRLDTTKILESDSDDQLILYVPFTGIVKLKSFVLRCFPDETAPKRCEIFMNREDIDFDTIGSLKPVQSIDLVAPENAGEIIEYPVKTQFYGSCRNITLFFTGNWSTEMDQTRICLLGFKGIWSELRKQPVITIYEAAPNPMDHIHEQTIDSGPVNSLFLKVTNAFHFYLKSSQKTCFLQELPKGMYIVGKYTVNNLKHFNNTKEAGVRITIYESGEKVSDQLGFGSSQFIFTSDQTSKYQICFEIYSELNQSQHIRLILDFIVGETGIYRGDIMRVIEKMAKTTRRLNQQIFEIKLAQKMMREKEEEFRTKSEIANGRVLKWALVQLSILFATSIWQTIHLQG
ncbi:hypothetical protein MERGE_003141 [Pneumocystis wakefieldiae]|uniref:PITH domain-containing protein n=1 Tax=Pneumocystis wakefieldiae TaxID=38082 RepID=A0A899G0D9_9ASCO|nr:hypothetical protein MERGE_003141 [Pneumocystis wakefieldiae]